MHRERITLTEERETLLIPLYGKAVEQRIIADPTAEAIVDRIDYDFSRLRTPWVTRVTLAMRAKRLDAYVRDNPTPLVLHLGCGLDARVHRVDSTARWYDIDYPEVIELRRQFYDETTDRRMIGCSVTDRRWMDQVTGDGPATIIAEGLLMYLHADEVRELLLALRERFPGSQIGFDAFTTFVAKRMARHPSLKKTGARVHWGIDDPREIEDWAPGIRLMDEWTFADSPDIDALGAVRGLQLKAMFALPVAKRAHRILRYQL